MGLNLFDFFSCSRNILLITLAANMRVVEKQMQKMEKKKE